MGDDRLYMFGGATVVRDRATTRISKGHCNQSDSAFLGHVLRLTVDYAKKITRFHCLHRERVRMPHETAGACAAKGKSEGGREVIFVLGGRNATR
jgi:hypothetical protein